MAQRITQDSECKHSKARDLVRKMVEQRLLPLVSECKHQTGNEDNLESVLQGCLFDIHTTLEDNPELHNLCIAAKRFTPESGNPVFNESLSDTSSYRLSLVGIHRLMSIPRHDHPKVTSVQLIISGGVRIRHFELAGEFNAEDKLVHLERASDREYSQGGFDLVTPLVGNIHDLMATKSTTVLLSLQVPPCRKDKQSWFFPLEISRNDNPSLICRRLKNHTLHSLHAPEMQADKTT